MKINIFYVFSFSKINWITLFKVGVHTSTVALIVVFVGFFNNNLYLTTYEIIPPTADFGVTACKIIWCFLYNWVHIVDILKFIPKQKILFSFQNQKNWIYFKFQVQTVKIELLVSNYINLVANSDSFWVVFSFSPTLSSNFKMQNCQKFMVVSPTVTGMWYDMPCPKSLEQ